MRTALDTNILSLFWSGEPSATNIAAQLSKVRVEGALVVSAPVFVELSAIPTGDPQRVGKLLEEMHIATDFDLGEDVWRLAATSFAAYAIRRRRSGGGSPKRLPADFVIAAHAQLKADRLMTRDANRYGLDFPNLRLI
ncbi:MAG: type II toxin-antitoxin system VapC family toxin [Candidatus Sulfotelmatobacter sp.]|jgi:predicted nucleic acid-binding protein